MNQIEKEKLIPYAKMFGVWLVYYVILGVINTKISLTASQSPEEIEKYVRSTSSIIIPILMSMPFLVYFGIGIVALIRMLVKHLKKQDNAKAKKTATDSFVFLAVCYLVGGIYYKVFPDHVLNYLNKINVENNKQKIENNLTKEEITQITEEIKKDNNILPVLRIKDVNCDLAKKEATDSAQEKVSDVIKNTAENCQNGDIETTAGRTYYCGPTCGQGLEKYYLMRKTDNKWQIVKMVGESKWVK